MTLHHMVSTHNGHETIGYVTEVAGVKYFRIASASGPLEPMFKDCGPLYADTILTLSYDYCADEYATQHGWECTVVRINKKSVTVRCNEHGTTHRIIL